MTSLSSLYRSVRARLAEAEVEAAALDARLFMDQFAGAKPEDIVCRPLTEIAPAAVAMVERAVARRIAGEPVHRILGWREFHGLKLALSPETLEPRPDTETLVDVVLPFVHVRAAATGTCRILDLGAGTGAVALALLNAEPKATALATDIAPGALATALSNAQSLGLARRYSVLHSNWFDLVAGEFDLIASNPPYIPSRVVATLDVNVRDFDPAAALDGGDDGLDAYRALASGAARHLVSDGLIAVEIGYNQAESATAIFEGSGFVVDPAIRDLGGNHRVLLARMRQ